jgi:hypothetical protein
MAATPRAIVGRIQLRYPAVAVAGKVISLAAIRAGETVDVDQSALDRKPAAIPKDWREIDNVVVHRPGSEVSFRWRGKDAGAP